MAGSIPGITRQDRAILDGLPIIAYTASADGVYSFISKQFFAQTGLPADLEAYVAWDTALHADDRERSRIRWMDAVEAGLPYEDELRIRSRDGNHRWHVVRALPVRDPVHGAIAGYVGTASDIDSQKRAEHDLRDLIALHQHVSAREGLYARIGEGLSGALSLGETLDVMLSMIVPDFADWMSVYLEKRDGAGFEVIAMRHWDEARRPIVDELIGTTFATGNSATAQVLRTGKSVLLERYPEDLRERAILDQYQLHLQRLGLRSAIVVPFEHRGKVIGAIHVIRGDNPIDFGPSDLMLIEELARRTSPAIYNAEAYERERLVARRFQEAALPAALPFDSRLTFDAVYEASASETQIGGDWYDAFRLHDGRIIVSIGDVAGHGLDAAVTMSSVRQSLRAVALVNDDPIAMLGAVDGIVRGLGADLIVTAFVGIIDPESLTLRFANAGHPPPLLRLPDGDVIPLRAVGLPLGLFDDMGSVAVEETLLAGSVLALYTDGLTEFERDPVEGERRVADALRASDGVQAAHSIYRAITAGRPGGDDIAILTVNVLQRTGPLEAAQWSFDTNDASTAALVRADIVARLALQSLTPDVIWAVELTFGELLSNAARHAAGRVRVLLESDRTSAVLQVMDEGPHFSKPAAQLPDPWSERGRGLFIAASLADEVTLSALEPRGNHVCASFTLGRQRE